ncbi:site-specific recombinase [Microcoleus sp. herbarium14]|uniref:site-specific recombinase n=1 Tax=Microcoleus sp. herbarium14 TaxID=3055439 RepID=UPI002FD12A12
MAIQNIDKSFKTEDGIVIQALTEPDNMRMIAVVGDKTSLDTTTKTGYRLCVPMLAPTHPDLIERLGIKLGKPPEICLLSDIPKTIAGIYSRRAWTTLKRWNKGFTQSHALRQLANFNGQMAGMSQETKAKNLGHSTQMNEGTYKKRSNTKTIINWLTLSTKEAIPLSSAI